MPNLQNLKPFKKGQSGNPDGGRKHNPDVKKIRRLSKEEVADIASLLLEKNIEGLQAVINDPNSSTLKVWTATLVVKSMKKGDSKCWDVILSRIIGKVPEKFEHTGKDGGPMTFADYARIASKKK